MPLAEEVMDFVDRLLTETSASLEILLDICGDAVAEAILIVRELLYTELSTELCSRVENRKLMLACMDMQENLLSLALATARGNTALIAMISRRVLEEASSMVTKDRRFYNTVPAIIAEILRKCSAEDVEEARHSLRKFLRDGVQSFLSSFVHPEGKGLETYLGVYGKPPIIGTDPGNLCTAFEEVLKAAMISMMTTATIKAIALNNMDYIEKLIETLNKLKNLSITRHEPVQVFINSYVSILECLISTKQSIEIQR